jgi:hypothetical protein
VFCHGIAIRELSILVPGVSNHNVWVSYLPRCRSGCGQERLAYKGCISAAFY